MRGCGGGSGGVVCVLVMTCLLFAIPAHADGEVGDGTVVTMTNSNMEELISKGSWLVKFYAPWCGHCKHIAPIYEEAAGVLKGKMNFGEVDATANSILKTKYDISGYPTIKFFRDGTVQDYRYPRTVEGFVDFATRMNGPSVHRLGTMSKIQAFTAPDTNPVSFIFAKPEDMTSAKAEYEVFKQVARQLQASQVFGETKVAEFTQSFDGYTAPFLVKVEQGEDPVILTDISDVTLVVDWVNANKFQVVTEITAMNFRDLSQSGRWLAIGAVDPTNKVATRPFLDTLRVLARPRVSPLSDDVRQSFHFCWLDGVRWEKFVNQFNIEKEQFPRLFVLDGQDKRFFEDVEVDELDEIETFLTDVVKGKVPAQREGIWGLPQRLWKRYMEWYPASVGLTVGFVIATIIACVMNRGGDADKAHDE